MIEDFNDFCLYMYVIVDDIWKEIAPCSSAQVRLPNVATANC